MSKSCCSIDRRASRNTLPENASEASRIRLTRLTERGG